MMSKNTIDARAAEASTEENNTNTTSALMAGASMQQTLCSYISQTLLPPDSGIELKPGDDLLSIDYLDSMQFMRLVQFVEQTYNIQIPPADLLIENFQTVERLTEYLTEQMSNS